MLSNLFLHEVLDDWFVKTVQPLMRGKARMIRYADDAVILCKHKEDAERIYKVLGLRFQKYGLKIHPEKTRLLDFSRPEDGQGKGKETFAFLGFTHYWTKSRKGRWMVGRKTDSKRFKRAVTAINAWCKANRHQLIPNQWKTLKAKVIGHYAYYGISLNYQSIYLFFEQVKSAWMKWLNRRSWKGSMSWESFNDFLKAYPLPKPKIMHSYA